MSKKIFQGIIKKILVNDKYEVLTKRSMNGLLNIFQVGSIHDLKSANDQYIQAKRNGQKLKILSKSSIKNARKEVRRTQADFLTSINNIEFEQSLKAIPRDERIKNRYNKKNVINYFNGKIPDTISHHWEITLDYLYKKLKFFIKDMHDIRPYKTALNIKVRFYKHVDAFIVEIDYFLQIKKWVK